MGLKASFFALGASGAYRGVQRATRKRQAPTAASDSESDDETPRRKQTLVTYDALFRAVRPWADTLNEVHGRALALFRWESPRDSLVAAALLWVGAIVARVPFMWLCFLLVNGLFAYPLINSAYGPQLRQEASKVAGELRLRFDGAVENYGPRLRGYLDVAGPRVRELVARLKPQQGRETVSSSSSSEDKKND